MKSGLKIKWSLEAVQNLENIINYLEQNWTQKEISKFLIKFEKQLYIISLFPTSYPKSSAKENVHRCVLTKNTSIYYLVSNKVIYLLSVFDTRQDPRKPKA